MAPAQPESLRLQLSRSWSHTGHDDQDDMEQAGRSTTNLHAQASAASLRPLGRQQSNTATPLRNQGRQENEYGQSNMSPVPSQSGPTQLARPLSQTPTVTTDASALRSTASTRSFDSSSSDLARTRGAEVAGVALSAGFPPPPPIPASRPSYLTAYGSSSSLSRLGTPRSVRDLGQDYDRYYNPFISRNSSSTDLAMPSTRHYAATDGVVGTAGLAAARSPHGTKRLSDPFDDNKHIRPPGSKSATVTATPVAMASRPLTPAANEDPENAFFPVYLDDRFGAPGAETQGYSFPMYWDEKEPDDDMHMPMVDDDRTLRPSLKEHFTRDTIFSTLGLVLMVMGLITLFFVFPVLSAYGVDVIGNVGETPLDQMWGSGTEPEVTWATVNNNRTWPLLKNIRTGLIDPNTPQSAQTRKALNGTEYKLVFSDEFSEKNRTFYQGDDPYWYAPDIWYGATMDLEWYDPDAVNTWDGALELRLDAFGNHGLQFRSGMLNSWNQLCFKGGIFEVSVSLPGPGGVHGLWPGVWSMGNLGRPGYLATTDGMWPYTYNQCDAGITPNQSSPDGLSKLPGQRLTSCGCKGEDHPTPGTGRGAPEIDIIEVSADWGGLGIAVATQSYQVAPFDVWYYPDYAFMETPAYGTSFVNTYTGGPFQQAVSTTTMLNNDWYDGEVYQKYAYEYTPGSGQGSGIAWWVGDQMTMRFDGRALGPNGNIGQRLISEEPMSMILNLGISNNWVNINWTFLDFPAVMRVDYVRLYQPEGAESVTCDPPGYETTEYIAKHPEAYNNPNYTHWTDIPGYTWPKNTLMNGCQA